MKAKRKTIHREGDQTWSYKVGSRIIFKWHVEWTVIAVRYDSITDDTIIRLEKNEN